MENSQQRRQEIYDKIKTSSKQEYILSEMKRLGFWNEDKVDFKAAADFLEKEADLSRKIQAQLRAKKVIQDPEAYIAQKHKERKLASKQRQKETKEKREKLRQEKAAKWAITKEKDIIYLGNGHSHELNQKKSKAERLLAAKLPVLHTAEDLSKAMGISIAELRFLAFSRKNSTVSHYRRFKVPKKSGGHRLISAPMPRLKKAQHWILETILNSAPVHPNAHGCVTGKSIKTNALPHVSKAVVINQDLQNFFPSITYERIKGMFASLGYSGQVSTLLALLCSEPRIADISLLGQDYFAQRGKRFLPQGSPCSPAIANIVCRRMDFRLSGIAEKYGFTYTRYVDDITFSTDNPKEKQAIKEILIFSKRIIKDENFTLHPDKLRVMKKGRRQEVTGVVVNEKPNISKANLKRFRALLFQIEKDGIEGKEWNGPGNILAKIDGYANFIYQIDPEKGAKYKQKVALILAQYNYKEQHRKKYANRTPKKGATKTQPERKSIWAGLKAIFKR